MYIYLVDYTVPPPLSDGGLIVVLAKDDYECHDILLDEWESTHHNLIMEAVNKAPRYEVVDTDVEPGIVSHFIM